MTSTSFFREDNASLIPVALSLVVNNDVRVDVILVNAGRKTSDTNKIIGIYIMCLLGVRSLPPVTCGIFIEEVFTKRRAVHSQAFFLANIIESFTEFGLAE
jgi:hypothetical protein